MENEESSIKPGHQDWVEPRVESGKLSNEIINAKKLERLIVERAGKALDVDAAHEAHLDSVMPGENGEPPSEADEQEASDKFKLIRGARSKFGEMFISRNIGKTVRQFIEDEKARSVRIKEEGQGNIIDLAEKEIAALDYLKESISNQYLDQVIGSELTKGTNE